MGTSQATTLSMIKHRFAGREAALDRAFETAPTTASAGILGALGSMMGVIFVIVALVSFVIPWGYLGGKSWARIIGLVFAGLDGLYGILTLPGGLITAIIATIMIYYLTRPQVLEWFSPNPVTTA